MTHEEFAELLSQWTALYFQSVLPEDRSMANFAEFVTREPLVTTD
jgi:hypothetical protein